MAILSDSNAYQTVSFDRPAAFHILVSILGVPGDHADYILDSVKTLGRQHSVKGVIVQLDHKDQSAYHINAF